MFNALRARLNDGWARQLFDCDDAAEDVPLEKHVGERKAAAQEQFIVFFEPVRDQGIFESFTFLGDYYFAVTIPLFDIVILLDERAVDLRVLAQDLVNHF